MSEIIVDFPSRLTAKEKEMIYGYNGELIRCKGCRFFHESPRLMGEERNDGRCEWIDERLVEQDHYCSWGTERSEDGIHENP